MVCARHREVRLVVVDRCRGWVVEVVGLFSEFRRMRSGVEELQVDIPWRVDRQQEVVEVWHGKVAQGKFQPQNCDALLSLVSPLGGGSRFRVLEDLESDDCASGAAGREQKRALRQVSASTNKRVSCCRKQDDDVVRVGEQRPGGLYADVVLRSGIVQLSLNNCVGRLQAIRTWHVSSLRHQQTLEEVSCIFILH